MFKLIFEFKDREADQELACVNGALAGLPLGEMQIAQNDGYLRTKTAYDAETGAPVETSYAYGFDRLELECAPAGAGNGHGYQIDVQAYAKGEYPDGELYHELWCADHPDRVMRMLQKIEYENADAYVILHHERS